MHLFFCMDGNSQVVIAYVNIEMKESKQGTIAQKMVDIWVGLWEPCILVGVLEQ